VGQIRNGRAGTGKCYSYSDSQFPGIARLVRAEDQSISSAFAGSGSPVIITYRSYSYVQCGGQNSARFFGLDGTEVKLRYAVRCCFSLSFHAILKQLPQFESFEMRSCLRNIYSGTSLSSAWKI